MYKSHLLTHTSSSTGIKILRRAS